jgi:hypothetical protein
MFSCSIFLGISPPRSIFISGFSRTSLANIASGRPYTAGKCAQCRDMQGATYIGGDQPSIHSKDICKSIRTHTHTAQSILLWPHASLANSSVRLHSAICEISVIYVNSLP